MNAATPLGSRGRSAISSVMCAAAHARIAVMTGTARSTAAGSDAVLDHADAALGRTARVRTKLGETSGVCNVDACVYYGIPFAAPPTGDGRFAPPRAAEPWAGVRTPAISN